MPGQKIFHALRTCEIDHNRTRFLSHAQGTIVMMRISLGRHVFGLAAIAFGVITLVWHDFNGWQQIRALGNVPHREILVYLAAAVELLGGAAILWPRTARAGAIALGALYLVFALLWVPRIAVEPQVYDRWGNFFEQFSLVSGALIVYALVSRSGSERAARTARIGYIFFRNLRSFIYARATRISFRNGRFRSKVDSSRTNVLGHSDHHCVCACGHRYTFRAFSAFSVSITYGDADWLWSAGMAAGAFCGSA